MDPIEKKPLNHFLPGPAVLSFGTAGCNLGCRFCQNWDISKSRETDTLADQAAPPAIARSVAIAALRSAACPLVRADDHMAVLKVWAKRHRDLSRSRNQVVCRLLAGAL